MKIKPTLKRVEIAYTSTCLPDYFSGDARPWVTLYPVDGGYTSKQLRAAILSEFSQNATGGSDPVCCDFILDEIERANSELFYNKLLPACLNRDIKYRGKAHKNSDYELFANEPRDVPMLHIVFNLIRE
jgi:hypothetical protein